jgi:PIN domain nuclease of toxin-antitoxin system
MAGLVVDTHALVWYLLGSPRLSVTARSRLDAALAAGELLHVPAVSLIELTYLVEKGRLPAAARARVTSLIDSPPPGTSSRDQGQKDPR